MKNGIQQYAYGVVDSSRGVVAGENRTRRTTTGSNEWGWVITDDNEWQRVTTGDDGVQLQGTFLLLYSPGNAGYSS